MPLNGSSSSSSVRAEAEDAARMAEILKATQQRLAQWN
jgi:hypothetical protein